MNRIYRLVWNRKLNAFVVGSELASAQGKRSGPSKLSLAGPWTLAGLCGAIALAMAGPTAATDAKLADLQDLVAKYSNTDAQQLVSAALPAVNTPVSLDASVRLPSLVQVDASAALAIKPRASTSVPAVRARVGVRAAVPPLRPRASTATPAAALSVVADAALAVRPVAASANATVTATVGPLARDRSGLQGLTNALLPGKEEGGSPLHGTLASTTGAVRELTGEVLTGQPLAAGETLTSHATTTVTSIVQQVGTGIAGLGSVLLPGKEEGGNPVRDTVTETVSTVEGLTGGIAEGAGLGGVVDGLVNGVAPVLDGVGDHLGAAVGGVTGSSTLGNGLSNTVDALTGGLKDTTGALADGDVTGTVQNLLGTVDDTASTLLGATGSTLGGITGSGSGVTGVTDTLSGVVGGLTDGLSNVVGGLTGNPVTPSATAAAVTTGPSGLIVGNGGLVGSVNQLVDSPLSSILGGNGYIESGSLKVNSTNVMQTYSEVNLLGVPLVNLSPAGELLDGLGGLTTGGNSHLTLVGGVTSDSYITNINNGSPGGLLGLVLPDGSPAWASDCLDVAGLAQIKCWAVPAAQDYQVLIGDGAFANGSKEVVIGSNAEHRLAAQTADQVFVDANGVMTGVPTADYDARQGHSVVVGDSAVGTANAQTLLGAGATSDKANSVALGFKSDAARGGQDNYAAFGLTAAQTSIGEVAVGSVGRERQITHVAAGSQDTDAVNVMQLRGALDQIDDLGLAAVVYDADVNGVVNYGQVTLGSGQAVNGTVLANLAAGAVAAGSMEAVNGGQLFGLGSSMATYLGGGATFNGGVLGAPDYQINSIGAQGAVTLQQYGDIGSAFTSISESLLNLKNLPGTGPVATDPLAVQYVADGTGNPTNEVRLTGDGSGAAVALGNVADGSVVSGSLDAINGGQLAATNDALASAIGGTLQYNSSTGQWSAASFTVTSITSTGTSSQQTLGNVTDALAVMDGSIVNVNQRIDNIQNGGAGNEYFAVNSTKAAASATGENSVAAGPAATASGTQAVAIGDGANASAAGSVALGAGAVADRANTVSVGAAGAERQITNVGDGSEATDAVNVRQLQASQQGTVRYDQNTDGSTNYGSVTMGRPGTSTVIHNVGTGVAPTDAVNVAQLNKGMGDVMDWSKNYTDQRFNDVSRDMKRIDDRASAGVASAMAMAGLPQPTEAGKRMASMAASTFHGESSMAVGVSGVSDGGRWIYKLSGSANTRGDGGVTVGAGFQW
ncbi:ESPR-type extended signal peptide-containing protein [Stenotrophomonas humi]